VSGDSSSGDSYAASQTVDRQVTPFFVFFEQLGLTQVSVRPSLLRVPLLRAATLSLVVNFYNLRFGQYPGASPQLVKLLTSWQLFGALLSHE